MNLLFLSNSRFLNKPFKDASTRYRCYHFAEDLNQSGHLADVAHIDTVRLDQLDRYDVVVFSRPSYTTTLEKILQHCAKRGILTLADFDDLIFTPDLAAQMPQSVNDQAAKRHVKARLSNHLRALKLFDQISTSTKVLAQQVSAKVSADVDVICLPNGLSTQWLRYNKSRQKLAGQDNVISYLSGSSSHDHDFASIVAVLDSHLDEHQTHKVEVTGKLNFDASLFTDSQIRRIDLVPYQELPSIITRATVNIAPLANTTFNQCKSHIKFIEAAAFGIPTISSPIPDITKHTVPGLLIAESHSDWSERLNQSMDPGFKESVASGLIEYAYRECCSLNTTHLLIGFLKDRLNKRHENPDSISGFA